MPSARPSGPPSTLAWSSPGSLAPDSASARWPGCPSLLTGECRSVAGWLGTFDRLSAPIEHRYSPAEVDAWFTRAGLTVLSTGEEAGPFVFGRKPDTAASPR